MNPERKWRFNTGDGAVGLTTAPDEASARERVRSVILEVDELPETFTIREIDSDEMQRFEF